MVEQESLNYEDEFLTCRQEDHVFWVYFKNKAMAVLTDLSQSERLFKRILFAEKHPDIRAIVTCNHPDALSEQEYEVFLQTHFPTDEPVLSGTERHLLRKRQVNILNQFVGLCLQSRKLLIAGLQGQVATPFFGAALAMDLRLISADACFSLKHLKRGIGALPFFLPRMIGYSRAKQLLFCSKAITAEQAETLGLVNQVLPAESFERELRSALRKLCEMDLEMIKTVKYLIEPEQAELERYLERETRIGLI